MSKILLKALNLREGELGDVLRLLLLGFVMGTFMTTFEVGFDTLFLNQFDEQKDLPLAIVLSGAVGIVFTSIFSFLQNRMSFSILSVITLSAIASYIGFVAFEFQYLGSEALKDFGSLVFLSFVLKLPFETLILMIFWGIIARMFALQQQKRILGGIDLGKGLAALISYFAVPFLLTVLQEVSGLLIISFFAGIAFTMTFIMTVTFSKNLAFVSKSTLRKERVKYPFFKMFKNKYILGIILFTVISTACVELVDFAFLNASTLQYPDEKQIGSFLGVFGGITIVFSILAQTFVTDKLVEMYGLKITLLLNPILLFFFTIIVVIVGLSFGIHPEESNFLLFFLAIALAKLFAVSLKDAFDEPTLKLFFFPIDSRYRLTVISRLDGTIKIMAGLLVGSLLILVGNFEIFDLLTTVFILLPAVLLWIYLIFRMSHNYQEALKSTLNISKSGHGFEFYSSSVDRILKKEIDSGDEKRVYLALKFLRHIDSGLYEKNIQMLHKNEGYTPKFQNFLDSQKDFSHRRKKKKTESEVSVHDVPSTAQLTALANSREPKKRIMACQALDEYLNPSNASLLRALLRDSNYEVRTKAIDIVRSSQRREYWGILIDLLDNPLYANTAVSALVDLRNKVLPELELAFNKSSQGKDVMLKIIQIYKRIDTRKSTDLLWKKVDHPDSEVVEHVIEAIQYCGLEIEAQHRPIIDFLLEIEMSDAVWDIAALAELANQPYNKWVKAAVLDEILYNFDKIFSLLSLIYDQQSIQKVKENLIGHEAEGRVFAMELLSVFIDEKLKQTLPLILESLGNVLEDIDNVKKNEALQIFFPRQNFSAVEVLKQLTIRDYRYTNSWTRACAMFSLAQVTELDSIEELKANIFHPDVLIHEMAAWAVYKREPQTLVALFERLPVERIIHFKEIVIPSIENENVLNPLIFDKVLFLKQVDLFKGFQGDTLVDLAIDLEEKKYRTGDVLIQKGQQKISSLIIVVKGKLQVGESFDFIVEKETVAEYWLSEWDDIQEVKVIEDSIVYEIPKYYIFNLMINNHYFAEKYIKNLVEKMQTSEQLVLS